tara:strand:- start:354 stop:527 length:174 start_codon:yes stop_codon:yes gene_type:complete
MKYEVVIRLGFNKRPRRKDVNNKMFDLIRDNNVKYQTNKEVKLKLVTIQGKRYGNIR